MASSQKSDGYMNALYNVVAPLNGQKRIVGVAEYVARETLVESILRFALGMPRNWMVAVERNIYTTSMVGPLIFSEDKSEGFPAKGEKLQLGDAAMEAVRRLPGAIGGFIAQHIRANGMAFPKFLNKDFIVFLTGKVAGRVVEATINSSMPTDVAAGTAVLEALIERQREIATASDE